MDDRPIGGAVRHRAVAAAAVVGAVVLGLQLLLTHPVHASPRRPARPVGPSPVSCLDGQLRPSTDCPVVRVAVAVRAEHDDLVVTVRNAGRRAWAGGPIAAELPLGPSSSPRGATPGTGSTAGAEAGQPEVVVRARVRVGRCTFAPVAHLAPGASVTCRVPRRGLGDGRRVVWLTGFTGGIPVAGGPLGDEPPAVGVVPVATARSIAVVLHGSKASLAGSEATTPPGPASSVPGPARASSDAGTFPWSPLGVGIAVLLVGAAVAVRARRAPRR